MAKQDLFHYVALELSEEEILDIDIRAMGNVIHDRAFALSRQVNEDLLRPISQWLDDPDFLSQITTARGGGLMMLVLKGTPRFT